MKLKQIDYKYWASVFVCIFSLIVAVFVAFKYLFVIVFPFIIAWGFAFFVRQVATFCHKKTKIPLKTMSLIVTVVMMGSLGVGICFLIGTAIKEFSSVITHLSQNPQILEEFFAKFDNTVNGISEKLPFLSKLSQGEEGGSYFSNLINEWLRSIGTEIPSAIGKFALRLPNMLLFIFVLIISCFYFSLDLSNINFNILSIFPEKTRILISEFKRGVFKSAVKYVKSYLLIMLITFAELLIGLSVLRVRYALLLAVIFSVIDLLPVLGVGTMLVPWGIFSLFNGHLYQGAGLLILYVVITVVRQVTEPKIIGKHFGIHPLLTLFSMYAGAEIFGFFGIVIGPVSVIFIKSIIEKSKSDKFNSSAVGKSAKG